MDQPFSGYECCLVERPADFAALEGEWTTLHAASGDGYLSQGFDWAELCRGMLKNDGRTQFVCFVMRRDGRMTAVLPMVVSRTAIWRVARPLASPTNEYCPLLFESAVDVARVWKALRTEIGRRRNIDAIVLTYVRDDSVLAPWLKACPAATWISALPAPFIRTSEPNWELYRDQLPQKVQANLRRSWKRIRKVGEVEFQELTEPVEVQAAWRWMIGHKRRWLARKGLASPWIPSDDYFRFVGATLGIDGPAGRRSILALKLDGELIAAELVNLDRRRVEMFVVTYDPDYAPCAPGNLLRSKVLSWAFAQGLDYDLRIGGDAYKSDWANHTCDAATYVLALNLKGRGFAGCSAARQAIAERTPEAVRARVRSLLRLPARPRPPAEPVG